MENPAKEEKKVEEEEEEEEGEEAAEPPKLEPDAIMIAFRPCSRTPSRLPRDPSPRRADVVDGVH
eukprot:5824099-Pyramimonas_sp.AAC.1